MSKKDHLTGKQIAFAVAYARSGNGAQAARDAGYSKKSASRLAVFLLKKPSLLARVKQERDIVDEELRAKFQPLAFKALDRAIDILDHADVKNMSLVQLIAQVWEYAGLKPPQKSEISGLDGQPVALGVVAIPVRANSIEEWVQHRQERLSEKESVTVDAEAPQNAK